MLQPWTLAIASHAVVATLALALGPVQLLRRVKGDPVHRLLGRVWAVLMLWTAAGSFMFGGWAAPIDIFLRVLAAWTMVSVVLGVVAARRGRIGSHRRLMTGSYFGVVGAFIGVLAVPSRRVPSWFATHPYAMSLVAVAIVALVGALVAAVVAGCRGVQRSRCPARPGHRPRSRLGGWCARPARCLSGTRWGEVADHRGGGVRRGG